MPIGRKEDDFDILDWLDVLLGPVVDGTAESFEPSRWDNPENEENRIPSRCGTESNSRLSEESRTNEHGGPNILISDRSG